MRLTAMRMILLAAFSLNACQSVGGSSPLACPIVGSSDWAAWVSAMPGPGAQPKLIVTGKVTVPTGGYQPALELGAIAESYPVQVTAILHPRPPAGPASQAVTTHEVRGEWPMQPPVGSLTVRCGNQVLARISPVETAV